MKKEDYTDQLPPTHQL